MRTPIFLSLAALTILSGCVTTAQETCVARGYTQGTGDFNACVRSEEQAVVQRIKARRGGGHGMGNQGSGG